MYTYLAYQVYIRVRGERMYARTSLLVRSFLASYPSIFRVFWVQRIYMYLGTAALLLLCTIAPQVPGMVQHSMMFALHIVAVHLCKYIPCQVPRIIQVTNWLLLYSTGTYSTGVHGLMFNRFKRKPFCRRKPQV